MESVGVRFNILHIFTVTYISDMFVPVRSFEHFEAGDVSSVSLVKL